MRIVCPDCQSAYEVPDHLLIPGKAVRCAKCGRQWAPVPPAPPSPMPDIAPPQPPVPYREVPPPVLDEPKLFGEPRLPTYRARNVDSVDDERPPARDDELAQPGRNGATLGWVASLVVLLLLGWMAFAFRADVIAAWPASARLFAALGLR